MIFTSKHMELLHAAIADIALLCGHKGYYSGNSRADIAEIINWANEFTVLHANTNWDEVDYMLTIDDFALNKIKQSGLPLFEGCVLLYTELINECPEYTDVVTSPVFCKDGDCSRCSADSANMWTVYLRLTDGREMAVADFNVPGNAELLKNFLKALIKADG